MSLARSTRIAHTFAAARYPAAAPALAAVLARRALSSSARRSLAEPLGSPSQGPTERDPDYLNKARFGNKGPPLGAGMASAGDEPGKVVNPYKDGPSALDKAAHLFFFTEIVRGECHVWLADRWVRC